MKEARRNAVPLLVATALLLLVPIAYVVSYLLLAEVAYTNYGMRVAAYRAGGGVAGAFFYPLERADRQLRPGQWESLCVQPAE